MLTIHPASDLRACELYEALDFFYAWAASEQRQSRIERLLVAFEKKELDPALFLIARSENQVMGCLACQLVPGRAARFDPVRRGADAAVDDALLAHAVQEADRRGVRLIQTLLPIPDLDRPAALVKNGFCNIAPVWTMCRDALKPSFSPAPRLQFTSWAASADREIQRVLCDTFVGSLDFPEINGLRTSEELFEGSQAAAPDPARWWLAGDRNEPVGVLLMGDASLPGYWNLAFLGIVPAQRQKGFGKDMLRFALERACEANSKGITLAVDDRNLPAIHLYQQFGFQKTDVKQLFLRVH